MIARVLFLLLAVVMAACSRARDTRSSECDNTILGERIRIDGGTFKMGSEDFYPEETPIRSVNVAPLWISTHEVTNRQFLAFVRETGYITMAERKADPALHPDIDVGKLVAGGGVFQLSKASPAAGRWVFVEGASWRSPIGPGSEITDLMDYPVVQVAYEDALAYARWVGGDLPTEAEWEFAARGGLVGAVYEWGDEKPDAANTPRANTWQGIFPILNTGADGFVGAAPVGCYAPNGYGLYDMTGNVWEWVKSSDKENNVGIVKGGSFLCAENYCRRFRPAARHAQELDFSTNHIGFRVVFR